MNIKFTKIESAGNDFILMDHIGGAAGKLNLNKTVKELCVRKHGVGADGVLVLEDDAQQDFRMRIFNADGGEVEMCGNGARCSAYYYFTKSGSKDMRFTTLAGAMSASVSGSGMVRLMMPPPSETKLDMLIGMGENPISVSYINTGVPHAVVEVSRLDMVDAVSLGRKIRNHREFAPAGTNADFVEVTGPSSISVRTYERGVEEETLACGTGSVACAIVEGLKGRVTPPVTVKTRGGASLKVYYTISDAEDLLSRVYDVKLEGRVKIIFEGTAEV